MAENKSASFEASLARLQEIVAELERENVELERSVALYREGRELVTRCEGQLKSAEETLRQAAETTGAAAAAGSDPGPPDEEIPF
jgi:exodeoxyribonuclease VII small subunit